MSKDDLIFNNINLIYFVIYKMHLNSKKEYYYDIGLMGLVKAANDFDPDKGYKFSCLAIKCIRNEILMDMRSNSKLNKNTISLDEMIYERNDVDVALIDTIPSDFDIEENFIEKEEKNRRIELLNKAISTLKEDEKKILFYYYNENKMTQQDIAIRVNISQAHVSRKIKKIIKKLQDFVECDKEDI